MDPIIDRDPGDEDLAHDANVGIPGWKQVEPHPECGICFPDGDPTPFCPVHGSHSVKVRSDYSLLIRDEDIEVQKAAYELLDPKHPDHHDLLSELADRDPF